MDRSGIIIYGLLAVVTVALGWAWLAVGFTLQSAPLLLTITIAWVLLAAVAIMKAVGLEERRCQKVRNVYVGDHSLYNGELGEIPFYPGSSISHAVSEALDGLRYDRVKTACDPKRDGFEYRCLVRSRTYNGADHWTGDVVIPLGRTSRMREFQGDAELERILETL